MVVKRKWGYYLTLISREHFKVKLLWFRSGDNCSMQRHKYRNEVWCFLYGLGAMLRSVNGKSGSIEMKHVGGGHCSDVPVDTWHQYRAYRNTLVLEIQYGEKCAEDDIERK